MIWQWLAVIACIIVAAAYIARTTWRTLHPKAGACGGGCGCAKASGDASAPRAAEVTLIPLDQLTVRRR
jgi:hypothetical protein